MKRIHAMSLYIICFVISDSSFALTSVCGLSSDPEFDAENRAYFTASEAQNNETITLVSTYTTWVVIPPNPEPQEYSQDSTYTENLPDSSGNAVIKVYFGRPSPAIWLHGESELSDTNDEDSCDYYWG